MIKQSGVQIDFSVIIPAFNEARVLLATLHDAHAFCQKKFSSFEIIVVDDASTDQTGAIAEAFSQNYSACRVITHRKNLGKGASVRDGLSRARGRIILFMDADNATPIDECTAFLPWFSRGCDIVIGSRYLPTSSVLVAQSAFRIALGRMGNLLIRALLLPGINDTQCGFKALSYSCAQAIAPRLTIDGWGFDMELLALGRMLSLRIVELPVAWKNADRKSRFRPMRDAHRTLRDLLLIKMNLMVGRYKKP